MRRILPTAILLSFALAALAGAQAQSAPGAACAGEEHRQFDFWIGDWEVRQQDGTVAGTNRIESILDGCVLEESWTGARGMRGHSFNIYSKADQRWHQTWVDSNGTLLQLAGGLEDGEMVMSGKVPSQQGEALHEIRWRLLDDGRVRQHWRVSSDGGETWRDLFVGYYTQRK